MLLVSSIFTYKFTDTLSMVFDVSFCRLSNFLLSNSYKFCFNLYSFMTSSVGLIITQPWSPSTIKLSPFEISFLAFCVPTTEGMLILLARIAV